MMPGSFVKIFYLRSHGGQHSSKLLHIVLAQRRQFSSLPNTIHNRALENANWRQGRRFKIFASSQVNWKVVDPSRLLVVQEPIAYFKTYCTSQRWVPRAASPNLSARFQGVRFYNAFSHRKYKSRTTLNYLIALCVIVLGASYAAVPLYRVFCQVTGIGGASNLAKHGDEKVENLKKVTNRRLRIVFHADTASHLNWNFRPVQHEVTVYPGETALAFYTAENPTDRPIVGISTYTVLPYDAAKYLNKIQCFCFEEQRLNAHEEVDMPVFFYIDPEYVNDPWLQNADTVTLSYTFFEAKDGSRFLGSGIPQNQPGHGAERLPAVTLQPA